MRLHINQLNSNLTPTIFFAGNRQLNTTGTWHPDINFSMFSRIDMQIDFQGSRYVLTFYTNHNDDVVQAFSFASYNTSDNKCRIVTGKLKFAGRYITQIGVTMSYDLQPFTQLDPSTIWVQQIIGYK